jgi:hypothetical protein
MCHGEDSRSGRAPLASRPPSARGSMREGGAARRERVGRPASEELRLRRRVPLHSTESDSGLIKTIARSRDRAACIAFQRMGESANGVADAAAAALLLQEELLLR